MKPETRNFVARIQTIEGWLKYLQERVASGAPWPNSKYITRNLDRCQLRVWPPVRGEWLVQIVDKFSRSYWHQTNEDATAEGIDADPRLAMTIALLQLRSEADEEKP